MPDLEQQIAEAHSDLEATEQQAKQLEARLRGIPGMERLMPSRTYGQPVDIAAKAAQERREAQEQAAEALRVRTEQLAAENSYRRESRQRLVNAGVNPNTGRRFGQ